MYCDGIRHSILYLPKRSVVPDLRRFPSPLARLAGIWGLHNQLALFVTSEYSTVTCSWLIMISMLRNQLQLTLQITVIYWLMSCLRSMLIIDDRYWLVFHTCKASHRHTVAVTAHLCTQGLHTDIRWLSPRCPAGHLCMQGLHADTQLLSLDMGFTQTHSAVNGDLCMPGLYTHTQLLSLVTCACTCLSAGRTQSV